MSAIDNIIKAGSSVSDDFASGAKLGHDDGVFQAATGIEGTKVGTTDNVAQAAGRRAGYSSFAGTGVAGALGTGGMALLSSPLVIVVIAAALLYARRAGYF